MRIRFLPAAVALGSALLVAGLLWGGDAPERRSHVTIRGIYGGLPAMLMEKGKTLGGSGVNAVWIGERGITSERVRRIKAQGAKIFAEFNTLHRADYLKEHDVDGAWLDYHHAHASWERAEPALPDTCFCARCRARFEKDTGLAARRLLDERRDAWISWRCGVFTDWVREFRSIVDETRPAAPLGTFHCPWSDDERQGALRSKLAIDLRAQSRFLDVFSPMPYHARFGYADDPAWISRQTTWPGKHLGLRGVAKERVRIWPIVQLADWGEAVSVEQIETVLEHATRPPATGVSVFRWGALGKRPEKVAAVVRFYRAIGG